MGIRRRQLPSEVVEVRSKIEKWRKTRKKRTTMPENLWSAASALARDHGVNPISRALGLSYESLKRHVVSLSRDNGEHLSGEHGFVQLSNMPFIQPAGQISVEVEICNKGGERMVIRLNALSNADVRKMVDDFWSRCR